MQPPFPSLTASWHNAPYPAIDPKQPHLSVSGKTVLITGGGRGIGARIAKAYAAAGASTVAITGRTESSLKDTKSAIEKQHPGTKVLTFAADVLDETALNTAFAVTKDASTNKAGIDICVANAGYLPNAGSIASSDPKDWWRAFEVNVLGTYLTIQAFLANIHAKSASNSVEPVLIELTTAAVCFFPPPPQFSGYITSKVASARLIECVAVECPDVRFVSVHPGVQVETEMGRKAVEAGLVLPEDDVDLAAHFMVWLASEEAEFLRSRTVWCNWDIEELKAKKEQITADPAYLNMGMNGFPYQA